MATGYQTDDILYTALSARTDAPEGMTFIEQAFEEYDGHLIVLYEMR